MTRFLTCRVSDGMFPSERMIEVDAIDKVVSFFVSDAESGLIQKNQNNGYSIAVNILDETEDVALVSLPRESLEGTRIIKTNIANLKK
jgi:hypothetical protein